VDWRRGERHHETTFSRESMGRSGQWLVDEAARLYLKAFQ
jgi:hypothetical protein